MKSFQINCNSPYPIYLGSGLLTSQQDKELLLKKHLESLKRRCVLITESNLAANLGKKLHEQLGIEMLIVPSGEQFKTRETKQYLEDLLLEKKYGRDSCFVALGGGVVTDIVGFLAATYCRGVASVYIPTTLLAMADASIGGKTAVNTPFGKNMIGAFYQPQAVFMDVDTLDTLSDIEWKNGLAEIIKHALICDKNLFEIIKGNKVKIENRDKSFMIDLIFNSCQIKKNIVEHDERESGLRQVLNFGHTIAHGIEAFENYKIGHGQAVAIGMMVESYLSMLCGFLEESEFLQIKKLLDAFGLCISTKSFADISAFKVLLQGDKKNLKETIYFVLIKQIGQFYNTNTNTSKNTNTNLYSTAVEQHLLDKTLEWADKNFTC